MPRHDERKLSVIYDKRQKDFVVKYPRSCDGHLTINHLVQGVLRWELPTNEVEKYPFNFKKFNFIEELERRGYNIESMKFSIKLKEEDYETE